MSQKYYVDTKTFFTLILSGILIGLAPIFVRYSSVSPVATAFWRLTLPLPILLFLVWKKEDSFINTGFNSNLKWAFLTGLFFSADLSAWHYSIKWTTVANSTLLANLAPLIVSLILIRIKPLPQIFWFYLFLSLIGTWLLTNPDFDTNSIKLKGDLLGLLTAFFYAGYFLSLQKARQSFSVVECITIVCFTSFITLGTLLLFSNKPVLPSSFTEWLPLLGLAFLVQILGQGLIAHVLKSVHASITSLTLLIQPFTAALLAWFLFSENLSPLKLFGGALVIYGIYGAKKI